MHAILVNWCQLAYEDTSSVLATQLLITLLKLCMIFILLQQNRSGASKIHSAHQIIVFGGKSVGKTTIISYFSGDDSSDIRVLDQQFVSLH